VEKIDKQAAIDSIPTSWLESLLTGAKSVMVNEAGKWGCPDVERLLTAVRDRIQALPAQPEASHGDLRAALEAAAACLDALDPRQPSGLSDAETASLFNSTREAVRLALT
jgi:hypothetical protein